MAAPVWQTSTTLAASGAANAVIAIPGAPLTANDVIIVTIYKENTAAVTPHSGYTEKGTAPTTTAPQAQHTFWFRAAGGETGNLTFSWTGSVFRAATAHRITGCITTGDPIEAINANFNNSAASPTPAVSLGATSVDSLLYWAATNWQGGNAYTAPGTYTLRDTIDVIGDATKTNTAGGATGSVTGTANVSGPQTAVLLSLISGAAAAPSDAGLWIPQSVGIIMPQSPLYFPFMTPRGEYAAVPGITDASLAGIGTLTADLTLAKSADAALTGTGTLSASATGPERFITSIAGSGNQQYPVDQNSDPILVKGDVIWAFPANAGRWNAGDWQGDITSYLDVRQGQGFNLLMIGALGSTQNGGPSDTGTTWDGVSPWASGVKGNLNTTYWDRVDYIVDQAAARGITCLMNVAYSYDMDTAALNGATNTQYTNYGTNLGNRYKTKPNLIWGVGGDYFDTQQTQIGNLFTAISATGDTHLRSVQNYPESTSRKDIFNNGTKNTGVSWSSWNFVYSYNVTYDGVEYAYDETSPIMAIWGDGHFDQNSSGDRVVMRNDLWWAFSSGARGHIYGSEGTWNWQTGSLSNASTETVPSTDLAGYWSIFTGLVGWWKLVPDTDSSFVTAGRGTHAAALTSGGGGGGYDSADPQDQYVTASVAPDGSLAVVYSPVAHTITVNPAEMSGTYTVRKVDPANGSSSSVTISATYAISGTNSRGGTDWLLVFEAANEATANLAGTGTLSGTAVNAKPATAALTGTGTLSPTATTAEPVDGTISGTGSLSGTASNAKPVTASLAGTGTLTASASTVAGQFADAALTGTGTLTSTASASKPVDATLTGTGSLTPTATSSKPAGPALSGTGTLSGTAASAKPADASLAGTGTITAAASTSAPGGADATLAGTGTLTASGSTAKPVAASLAGTATVASTITREQQPAATLAGTGSLTGSAATGKPVTATLTGTGTISAAASVATAGPSIAATLTGTGSLSATASVPRQAAATLAGSGTITAQAVVSRTATAVLAGVGSLLAAGDTQGQVTARPFTGDTTRPSNGRTIRPNTGITNRP